MLFSQETIVALATPPGQGAIGIIRLSGNDALSIAQKIFQGKDLKSQPSHTAHFGKIVDGSQVIDEVLITIFRAPKSYTGEDTIEISCHGSSYILQQVLNLCTQQGALLAKPGEFTQRAFLNGKMDLAQAESVADVIASQTASAHQAAMYGLRGGFSHDLQEIREELIKFSALIELELDFSEEDVQFADRTKFFELIEGAKAKIQALIDSFKFGNVIKNGIKVAIVGRPNAGKSTLLNALLNDERAIVSDIAGTTRDTIEETLNINGIIFRLIDTAGIRSHSTDAIENIGIARSKKAIEAADIVIVLVALENTNNEKNKHSILEDSPNPYYTIRFALMDAEDIFEQTNKAILVVNKEDLLHDFDRQMVAHKFPNALYLSAKNGIGISELKQLLYNRAMSDVHATEGAIVTNARHQAALKETLQALLDIETGMNNHLSGDLLALDIRRCLHFLGTITGQVTTEDKLDYIFSKFCIGK
ncbi:MAG: tRNA uridine-5-carboxymethylaminomethyl(34) synthesis GTPase MnmE [Bacteroidetes bacterium]|nr:tRNA uridine-5-carboxymethylaminomethyl(34) synthesis GTPase MnmE [Bacteroidota bacterium]MBS1739450.1 tRNA uridine-5-carboxymethylaminomethyl(34) synthesis GTPase MnmE [Bacteroidota bacterium]